MKLLYLILFSHLFVFAGDATIEAPKALSLKELDELDIIFQLENIDDNILHFEQELDLNFLKKIESSSGYIDEQNKFKVVPCRNFFNLYRKKNNEFVYIGKILYPQKFYRPSSIFVSDGGKSIISVMSKFDKINEVYDYQLFAWLEDGPNKYKRFNLGYIDTAAMSSDGSTIIGYYSGSNKSYYWHLLDGRYKLTNDTNIHRYRSSRPIISINQDGTRYLMLNHELTTDSIINTVDNYYLELDLYESTTGGSHIDQTGRFNLPAKRAYADLNAKGDIMALYYEPTESRFQPGQNYYCIGENCEKIDPSEPRLLIINLKDFYKSPDLLFYGIMNKSPDRLKIESDSNLLLLGYENYYDLYQFKMPELQKIVPEVEEKISCESLLASLDDQT
jgi:hypothetical protein